MPAKSLFALLILITLTAYSLPGAKADLVVTEDLGVLEGGSSTTFSGDTAEGANNADTYVSSGALSPYGNEVVFKFTIEATMRIDVTSIQITGDPDVFLLNSLETAVTAEGLNDATGAINYAFLDAVPPANAAMGILGPGTYYLSIDSFGGDATFAYNLITNAVVFPDPDTVTDLGTIAEPSTPFTMDTIGNTIDTEMALWDDLGNYLIANDDALLDFDGDGVADIYQSQLSLTGLVAGRYFVAVGSWNTIWGTAFTFLGGQEGGPLTFNYGPTPVDVVEPTPAENSVTGELAVGGVLWYSFEIGAITPPAPSAPLEITNVVRNDAGAVSITFNSVAGNEYAVEISTDVTQWQELTDGLVGEAETTTYTHTSPDQAARSLYYRIRQLNVTPPE
jgi:hypothetical protein